MGGGVALQLVEKGWVVHAYNRTRTVTDEYAAQGVTATYSLKEMVDALPSPKVIWLMVPAGKPVDDMLFGDEGLVSLLNKGDIIIDGGNSNFNDTKERYRKLSQHGIRFMDVGTSGGPAGARYGACLMIGGDRDVYEYLRPLFCDLATPNGMQFFEGPGAGHFVKMVHNGIEYGMMQAIAEGFNILKQSDYNLDLKKVADIYNHGSVIESRLIGWLLAGFEKYGDTVDSISPTVHHSGEGQWTVETAKKMGVDVPIIEGSLQFRIDSSKKPSYTGKIVNLLRNMFGGHENALVDTSKK
jgi:6-phosphogluconate dehydrogenase